MRVPGNAYWASGGSESFGWLAGRTFDSLAAFRAGTGQEETPSGVPTGSDADPGLSASNFFQDCVAWKPEYPALHNSRVLDSVRGFSGCGGR